MTTSTITNDNSPEAIEERLKAKAEEKFPESWKPQPGQSLTVTVVKYDTGNTSRGEAKDIMVVELLRNPGNRLSIWILGTVLENKINELRPMPGERIFIQYDGLVNPKQPGGDPYHAWTLTVDRDEAAPPPGGFPWERNVNPRTAAQSMHTNTAPPMPAVEQQPWDEQSYQENQPAADDDIPF